MATNKNQHFVPRCYLRPFTTDAGDAAINVFNLDRKRLIPKAPVKNQCSRDYFYGTDAQLEKAIQLIESGYSEMIRNLIIDNRSFSDASKTVLKTFWLFQHLRTEAAASRAVQMADETKSLVGLPSDGEYSFGIKDAVRTACITFAQSMHEIDDLKFCLAKNKTNVPFITSDNPAILTNRWHLDSNRCRGHSFGIGSAGTLAFLPLTPKLFFIAYDGDVYSIPHEKGIVEIKNERDVIALNRHQFLQCVANTYIHDIEFENVLLKHYTDIESARPKARHVIHYAELDSSVGDHTRYVVVPPEKRDKTKEAILHSQTIHPHPIIWPSQIRIRSNGSVYTNGTGVGYVRYSRTIRSTRSPFRKERP